jgi:uncharacterized protein YraI
MHRIRLFSSFGALLLAVCGIATAQNAYTAKPMNVRAGPNRDYPLVAQVDAGTPLDVHGCLDGWSWCDVSFDGNRGWMYGGGIDFAYNGGRVPLYSYGPQVGLPIITFSLGTYWGQYYRGRPWYGQRNTWAHRNFPPPARLTGPARGGPQPGPRATHSRPGPMTHSRAPAPARSGGEMRGHAAPQGHAAPEGRGPPKGGHAQRPPSSHGTEHGGDDHQHGGDQRRNPP